MKIKSLLLGSAAALVAVSGARAADAVVIPEPEAVEYVRVCDAAGTGYFYIPGTETCLKIGGYVRYQLNFSDDNGYGDAYLSSYTKADVTFSSWTDSEYGPVVTFLEMNTYVYDNDGSDPFAIDSAYLSVGGLKMGYFDDFADGTGLNGETDSNYLNTKHNRVQYTGTAGGVSFGIGMDQLDSEIVGDPFDNDLGIGIDAMVGFTAGAVSAKIVGMVDLDSDFWAVIGMVSANVGPGTLQGRVIYRPDEWSWYNADLGSEWNLGASYAFKAMDKLTLTPGVMWDHHHNGADYYRVGLTADYALTKTFNVKTSLQYNDGDYVDGSFGGFVRFQASF